MIHATLSALTRKLREILGVEDLRSKCQHITQQVERLELAIQAFEMTKMQHLRADILQATGFIEQRLSSPRFKVVTDHPFAIFSDDYRFPRGSRKDNTRSPGFVRRCEEIFGRKVAFLDLGCAGGGIVFDFLIRDNVAIGIDGSGFPLLNQSFEWNIIPNSLFCADITHHFEIVDLSKGARAQFDVISSWEVLEHIPNDKLDTLFQNIISHLGPDGIYVASIATFDDYDDALRATWHQTVRPYTWWADRFQKAGFHLIENIFSEPQLPRGSGNGPYDWSASKNPELGFHIFARRGQS